MHRRWFWALMAIALLVIVVGWMVTIREVLRDVPAWQASVEMNLDRVAEEVEEAQIKPSAQVQETVDVFEALKAGYEAEKLRQEEEIKDL